MNSIEEKCLKKGVRLTDQRKTIAKVISESKEVYGSKDHPDVDECIQQLPLKRERKRQLASMVYELWQQVEDDVSVTPGDFE